MERKRRRPMDVVITVFCFESLPVFLKRREEMPCALLLPVPLFRAPSEELPSCKTNSAGLQSDAIMREK